MTAPEALQAWQFRESWAVSQAGLQSYLGIHGSLRDVASEEFLHFAGVVQAGMRNSLASHGSIGDVTRVAFS